MTNLILVLLALCLMLCLFLVLMIDRTFGPPRTGISSLFYEQLSPTAYRLGNLHHHEATTHHGDVFYQVEKEQPDGSCDLCRQRSVGRTV